MKMPLPYFQLHKSENFQYLFLVLLLSILLVVHFEEFVKLYEFWFLSEKGLSKKPIIWLVALLLMFKNASRSRILSRSSSKLDMLFLSVAILGIAILKESYFDIVPTLLLISIWFYSTQYSQVPRAVILWSFLIYSLPYFSLLTPLLQSMAVIVVELLLRIFDIPVLVQEFSIAIPRGLLRVEQSCSGEQYLTTNLILLFIYSLIARFNIRQYLLAFFVAVSLALLINWVRIFIIVIVANHWGFDVPFFVKEHKNLGLVLHILFLIPYFYIFLKIEKYKFKPLMLFENAKKEVLKIPSALILIPIFAFSMV